MIGILKDNAGVALVTLLVVWAARQTSFAYVDGY